MSVQPGPAAAMTSALEGKRRLQVQRTVSPAGLDTENKRRVGDKDTGSKGRPVSSGLQVPGDLGPYRAETRTTS